MENDICRGKHGGAETSELAFSTTPSAHRERCRATVLERVAAAGQIGLTCDELETLTGMQHQTCSARVTELLAEKRIHFTTARRKTRSGKSARVYFLGSGEAGAQLDMFAGRSL